MRVVELLAGKVTMTSVQTHELATPRRFAMKLWACVVALVLAVTGLTTVSTIADAASPGVGYGTWGDNVYGWHGSFNVGGKYIYCVQPAVPLPTGATTDIGYRSKVHGISGDLLAGMNAVVTKYGQTTNRYQAAAVAFAVKAAANESKTISDYNYDGRYGNTLSGAIRYQMYRYVGNDWSDIANLANGYLAEIRATKAGASGGSGQFTFQVDNHNNYLGTLTVSTNPTNATGTVTLTNGIFTDTGSKTRTGVKNGQVLPITGVPPAGSADGYKIFAKGDFTAPGGGYASNIRVYTTPNQQTAIGAGQLATRNFSFTGVDPVLRSGEFLPALSTSATKFIQDGQAFRDQVTFFTAADDNGVNNPWVTRASGLYRTVIAHGTLYGPYASQPAEAASAPAGAPVAATATVTTTAAKGPGTYTVTAGTARDSGYYTWVWEIRQADQDLAQSKAFIPEGYVFTDRFGLTAETSIVPMKPVATSAVQQAWAAPGAQVRDTLTVSNSSGLWLDATAAKFEGTAYGIPNGALPARSESVPSNAIVLGTQTLTFTGPGTKTSAAVTVPSNVGAVVWVWTFNAAAQNAPSRFATGYTWADDFGMPSEITRVQMKPTITTQVVSAVPTGAFNDEVTLSLGGGQWIDGTSVLARGTLYGPLLKKPTETAAVPAGAQVAHQTSLTFTSAGTQTTNTGFTPTLAGYYTWVWTISASEQNAATQQALPSGYAFADRYGQAAETSMKPMRLTALSKVVQATIGTGQTATDTLTVTNENGAWLTGSSATFTGTAYAVKSGTRPSVTNTVPSGAYAIGTQTLTFTANGKKTSAPVTVPNDAGYVVWVWTFATADQPAAQQVNFPAGYSWTDQFGLADETTTVRFSPVVSTNVVSRVPSGAFNDVVTASAGRGQWIAGTSVKFDGVLYGPFKTMPARSTGVPVDAPVAHTTSLTFTAPGTKTTNTGYRPDKAGFYTWVWSVDADDQAAATRNRIPASYTYQHDFAMTEETSLLPMSPVAYSQVNQKRANAGDKVTDTLTVSNTNGDWFTGAKATYTGTAYTVPADEAPKVSNTVPADAVPLLKTTITADRPGTYTSAAVTVPQDAGFIVWVWEFDQAKQADPEKWMAGLRWSDSWALPEETHTITFQPRLSTQVVERVPGGAFNDAVTLTTSKGQWHRGTAVKVDGTLYGPFLSKPAVGAVPNGAPVAHETSLTFTAPGMKVTDTGFRPTKAGYYTWVWEIDADAQSAQTQQRLPDGYNVTDQFGLDAETSLLPMIPTAASKVTTTHADAGDTVADTLTISNTNGGWFTGAVATYTGTAYSVAKTTAPTVRDTVPADAKPILTTTITANRPGTYTSEGVTVPDDAGHIVWVWTFNQAAQADQEKWLSGMTWQDQFGLADETTTVTFQPTLSTKVTDPFPRGAFDDTVTLAVSKGQWHQGTAVKAQGVLYGPFTDRPAVSAAAPENAPVAHRTELTFTKPGTLTTDTGFRPDSAGYYTWQWTVEAGEQSSETQQLLPGGYVAGDPFGLENETSVRSMDLDTVTTIAHQEIRLGQASVDTMTVAQKNGEWLQVDGEDISVTYRGTAYFVEGDTAPERSSDIPESAEPMDTVLFDVTGAGEYVMPASRGEEHRDGFVTWVWEIRDADQADSSRGMTTQWTDDFGIPEETARLLTPQVETLSQAGTGLGGTLTDTAYITGDLPVRGAELTFEAYAVPMTKNDAGEWVIDRPEVEKSDTEVPADGDAPAEEPAPTDWSWVISPENLIGSNVGDGEIVTEAGEYHSPAFTAPAYAKVLWVESLWTIPLEQDASTESAEAGGEESVHPSFERQLIRRGVAGIPNETSFVLDVKTYAMSASGKTTGVEHGVETWDTAQLTGYVPDNGTLEFEAYLVPAADTAGVSEQCTPERLAWTSPAVALEGGLYPAGSPLNLRGDAHVFNPDVDSALYWVAVVKDELGREVHRGVCGDPDETVGLKGQKLIATGTPIAVGGAALGLMALSGMLFAFELRRRRRTA